MKTSIPIEEDESGVRALSETGETIASLQVNDWETCFFKRKFGFLSIDIGINSLLQDKAARTSVENLLAIADLKKFDVVDFRCDVFGLGGVPILEEMGFRLVDTAIRFVTLIEKPIPMTFSVMKGDIALATQEDLQLILLLTHECFTNNPNFLSRYKNQRFFTSKETMRYYSAWIENHIEDPATFFVVTRTAGRIIGYFIYKYGGIYKDRNIYRGILTAVAPDCRGRQMQLSMQRYIYDMIPMQQFYVENATQLNNYAVIINHMRSNKSLQQIELIFYRPGVSSCSPRISDSVS